VTLVRLTQKRGAVVTTDDSTTSNITVHLFGGPYVSVRGDRLSVPEGSKRLLAFVALRGGRVERRHVAGALWPVGDDCRAAGNLRSALWRLRGAGIDVLRCDKWSLSLRDGVAVDVHQLKDWADRVISGRPAGRDLDRVHLEVDALDLLPGWYDDWTILERERLRQRVLHALEAQSRILSAANRHADAVDAALAAIRAEPLRESAQRTLIEAYLGEDNWVEAQRTLDCYRDLLDRELAVSPSRDLVHLVHYAARRRHQPLLALSHP
jgi:DNA-binding SARP family transcriptional activator